MLPTRKATRNLVGKTLTELDVQKKYENIAQSKHRISKNEAMKAIKRFFKSGEIEVTAKTVPLICPISKSRIVTPVRGTYCKHVECFDLRTFLEYHTNEVYWECPFTFCRTKLNCDQLRLDEFFSSILQNTRSTIVEAEIQPDGTWTSVKPSVVGAIVIKEEEPDEPQGPQAPATACIAVKKEPVEGPTAKRTEDAVKLSTPNPKTLVIRRGGSAIFKAAQTVKRKAMRGRWKRRTISKARRDRLTISKGISKTPTKAPASKTWAQHLSVSPIGHHAQRYEMLEMLASVENRKDHTPDEQSPVESQSEKRQPLRKPLSRATRWSTDGVDPSLNNGAESSTPSDDRTVCRKCGACFADRSMRLNHELFDHSENDFICWHCGTKCGNVQSLRAHFRNCPDRWKPLQTNRTMLSAAKDSNVIATDDSSGRPSDDPTTTKNHPKTWTDCRCGTTEAEWSRRLHEGLTCDVMKRLLENYRGLGYTPPKPVKPKKVYEETTMKASKTAKGTAMKASKTAPKQTAMKASKKIVKQTATKASGSGPSMRLGVGTSRGVCGTTKAPPPP